MYKQHSENVPVLCKNKYISSDLLVSEIWKLANICHGCKEEIYFVMVLELAHMAYA